MGRADAGVIRAVGGGPVTEAPDDARLVDEEHPGHLETVGGDAPDSVTHQNSLAQRAPKNLASSEESVGHYGRRVLGNSARVPGETAARW